MAEGNQLEMAHHSLTSVPCPRPPCLTRMEWSESSNLGRRFAPAFEHVDYRPSCGGELVGSAVADGIRMYKPRQISDLTPAGEVILVVGSPAGLQRLCRQLPGVDSGMENGRLAWQLDVVWVPPARWRCPGVPLRLQLAGHPRYFGHLLSRPRPRPPASSRTSTTTAGTLPVRSVSVT